MVNIVIKYTTPMPKLVLEIAPHSKPNHPEGAA